MSFEFSCSACGQILLAGSAPRGSSITCPHCQRPTLVPAGDFSRREVAWAASPGGEAALQVHHVPAYHDVSNLLAASMPPRSDDPAASAPPGSTPPPALGTPWGPAPIVNPLRPDAPPRPGTMLLVSRRMVMAQGLVLLVVAAIGFSLGFLVGRQPTHSLSVYQRTPLHEVSWHANVTYRTGDKEEEPDTDAVIFALPAGELPPRRFASKGLRPGDTQDDLSSEAFRVLHDFGGDATRVHENGSARLVVSRPGKYYVLVISRHAMRPNGDLIGLDVLGQISNYFDNTPELIGQNQFRWSLEELSSISAPLVHQFGRP